MNTLTELESSKNGSVDIKDSLIPEPSGILKKVQIDYSEARIYTGKIESTFLYKRIYKTSGQHSHDQDTSYWWLTIRTFDGKLVSYNIHSENKRVDAIKKGDIISFIITENVALKHPLKIKKDKEIVKHNEVATTVVFHRKEDSFFTIDRFLKPVCKDTGELFAKTLGIFFIIALVDIFLLKKSGIGNVIMEAADTLVFSLSGGDYLGVLAGFWGIIWVVVTIMIDKTNKAKFSKALALYQSLEAASQKLMAFYFNPPVESVSSLSVEEGAITSLPLDESELEVDEEDIFQTVTTDVFKKFDQFDKNWSAEFLYRHVLAPNEKGTMQCSTYLARVVNKDISVSASKSRRSHTERTTTSYKNKYGTTLREEHSDRDVSHTTRTSIIKGSIEVCTAEHDILEVNVPTDALRSMDVGDWILLGKAAGNIEGSEYETNELTYNISKDIKTDGSSLSYFGELATMSQVILGLTFVGCLALDFKTDFNEEYLKMLFAPLLAIVSGFTVFNLIRNKLAKKRFLNKFHAMYLACKKIRSGLLIESE